MHFPALPGLTRTLAAVLLVAAIAFPQIERARGQEAGQPKQTEQHPAVPFIDLGQFADKGALRLLRPRSVTGHEIAPDRGPIGYTAPAGPRALHDKPGKRVARVF